MSNPLNDHDQTDSDDELMAPKVIKESKNEEPVENIRLTKTGRVKKQATEKQLKSINKARQIRDDRRLKAREELTQKKEEMKQQAEDAYNEYLLKKLDAYKQKLTSTYKKKSC